MRIKPFATRFHPPHEWDEGLAELRDRPASPYYKGVVPEYTPAALQDEVEIERELDFLIGLKPRRTGMELEKIRDEEIGFEPAFEALLGLGAATPRTTELIVAVSEVTKYWTLQWKDRINRPRPYQLDDAIEPLFLPGHPAYPSGHGGQSHAVALALVAATPARWHSPLRDLARDIGKRREVAGVHYPSDTRSGILLAEAMIAALAAHPSQVYPRQVEAARAELASLLK